jgi:hypothetical protein
MEGGLFCPPSKERGASHVLVSSSDLHPRPFPALAHPPRILPAVAGARADTNSDNCFCASCPSSQLSRQPLLAPFRLAGFATNATCARVPLLRAPKRPHADTPIRRTASSAQHPRAKQSHRKHNEANSKPRCRYQNPVFYLNPTHSF